MGDDPTLDDIGNVTEIRVFVKAASLHIQIADRILTVSRHMMWEAFSKKLFLIVIIDGTPCIWLEYSANDSPRNRK